MLLLGLDATLLEANPASWLILGEWGVSPGDRVPEPWRSTVLEAVAAGETREVTLNAGMVSIFLLFVPAREHGFVHVLGGDVTSRKQMERKIALNAQVFESASEGILIMDADMRVIDVNPAYSTITGYSPEEILGETAAFCRSEFEGPDFVARLSAALAQNGSWQREIWGQRKDGARYTGWLSIASVRDDKGDIARNTAVLTDITWQKELFRMAHYDVLTGLPNRRLFQDRLTQAMASADRTGECIAVMLIDLDGFKLVNDQLGHPAGDEMLRIVSSRIGDCVRASDTVARMGGDDFLLLLRQLKSVRNMEDVARKLLSRVAEPVTLENREFFLTASIGMAGYDGRQSDEELFRLVDNAMYAAKMDGKNAYRVASEEVAARRSERLTRQTRLRRAIEQGEITAHYQGVVDVPAQRLSGVEALARWMCPDSGLILPCDFIGLAEEAGLIRQLGEHILRVACAQGAAWKVAGVDIGVMSVNVSVRQLQDTDFVNRVEQVLAETGLPPTMLDLELSEALWIEGKDSVVAKLSRLREMGITVSIDDFGTKYASLSYLKRLPIDRIKIDKSFVDDLPADEITAAILESVMTMAARMGVEVIAEGVEHRAQLDFLLQHGCRHVQGYYFCRPGPADTIPALAARRDFSLEAGDATRS
ncbi:MAG: EAL domain-containing protein [Ectothiorhodospiraceae bacterium]|nr:EAL domain-containing protein [Ectothiorhodospiraceae bacterium]